MEYTNSRIREIIAEYVHSSRDRSVMEKRYIDGLTFEKLAEVHELSVSQVKRIIKKNAAVIFRHMDIN